MYSQLSEKYCGYVVCKINNKEVSSASMLSWHTHYIPGDISEI